MIFVLEMLFAFVYDRKNENHWYYSLLVTQYSEYKHPFRKYHFKSSFSFFPTRTCVCFHNLSIYVQGGIIFQVFYIILDHSKKSTTIKNTDENDIVST